MTKTTSKQPQKKTARQRTLFGARVAAATKPKPAPRPTSEATNKAIPKDAPPPPSAAPALATSKPKAFLAPRQTLCNEPLESLKARANTLMKDVFGIQQLRYLQPRAVESALRRQSQLVVMATGGGKSLCYQLPAVTLGGTTIVISPLKALITDQVEALLAKQVDAAYLSSQLSEGKKSELFERLLQKSLRPKDSKSKSKDAWKGQPPVTLLYSTPEQVQTERFRSALQELAKQNRLTGFAIDEAHCISQWGHDFRPAYRQLHWLRETFPKVPLTACTATATPNVIQDISTLLQLQNCPHHVGSFDRSNVTYLVRYKEGLDVTNAARDGAVGDLVQFLKTQHFGDNSDKGGAKQPQQQQNCNGIVYVHKKQDAGELSRLITKETGVRAASYHGGMKDSERLEIQQAWMSGEAPIAVATVAFGMGIDLAHVRYVVHWTLAKSVEAFYQESGRAGRDGLPSISLMYYSRDEASKLHYLASQKQKGKEAATDAMDKMIDYAIKPGCRRKYLLRFFGEVNCDPATVCQKKCDFCQNPEEVTKCIEAAHSSQNFSFHTKTTATKEWDGQWKAPHGEDDDDDNDRDFGNLTADGLLIRGGSSTQEFSDDSSGARRQSAESVLKKYEAIECGVKNRKGKGGFVNFRSRAREGDEEESSAKRDRGVIIPEHLRKMAPHPPRQPAKKEPPPKSSEDLAADASRLKAELEKIKAAKEAALRLKSKRAATGAPPPPPPPAMGLTNKRHKRR